MCPRSCRGVTLVELIVFMVIVGVAMSALFAAFGTITKASADPQVRKQMLAIAESLMDEVALMPFTNCDPQDPLAATAGIGGCTSGYSEDTTMGPELGETRYDTNNPFNNVSDYHNFKMGTFYLLPAGIKDIGGITISGLDAYSALILVSQAGLSSGVDAISAADALKISVTVTYVPNSAAITLESYRTRYQPNTLP